jgi:hypothetical protein
VAEEMLNNAVATKALTADELKGGVNNNVVKGLSAVANAEGSINEDFYTANKDAIDAYYKALTGTTDEAFKNVSTETILQKLNEVKEAG